MLFYFTEISKYLIMAVMALYVLECLIYEIIGENYSKATGICVRQRIYLFLIQAMSYGTLCLKMGKFDYLFLLLFSQVILFAVLILSAFLYPRIDKILLNNMALMISIGFIIISRLSFNRALKQFFIVAISLTIGLFLPMILDKIKGLANYGYIYAALGILPLSVVLLLGAATNGSKLSYSIAGITIQPSELVKIIFIFSVAALIANAKSFMDIVIATIVAAGHVLILVMSKDLGSGLIYFVAYLFMLFIGTRNYLFFGLGIASGTAAAFVAYKLFSHVKVRVQAFIDPFSVIEKEGYQISQSLFAISCGSFFGMGLSKGIPSDIPYVESDFIFSAISEEMGAVFAILLLLVCLSTFVIMLRTSMVCGKKFNRLLSVGFGVLYIFQVFLTVGGGIKFIPLTGVTLPFVSYGGSSILSSVILIYVVEWVIITYRNEEYEELLRRKEVQKKRRREREYLRERYTEDDEYYE